MITECNLMRRRTLMKIDKSDWYANYERYLSFLPYYVVIMYFFRLIDKKGPGDMKWTGIWYQYAEI